MSLNFTASVTGMEKQVADLIGWQRRLRGAVFDVRDDLPLSMRFALDRACDAPPEKLLTPSGLEEAARYRRDFDPWCESWEGLRHFATRRKVTSIP